MPDAPESPNFSTLGRQISVFAAHAILAQAPRAKTFSHPNCPLSQTPPKLLWHAAATLEAMKADISLDLLMSYKRKNGVQEARWRAWEHLHKKGYGWSAIGRRVDRDHSTVWAALKRLRGESFYAQTMLAESIERERPTVSSMQAEM
jgi:hypothetical protein